MSNGKTETPNEAVAAAQRLPEVSKAELMERVGDVYMPDRPEDFQELIKERLAKPRTLIARDDFLAMLRRYQQRSPKGSGL